MWRERPDTASRLYDDCGSSKRIFLIIETMKSRTTKVRRRISATVFDEHGTMRMAATNLYPTEKDQQVESKALHELARDLDVYVTRVIEFIRTNGAKTKLKTE